MTRTFNVILCVMPDSRTCILRDGRQTRYQMSSASGRKAGELRMASCIPRDNDATSTGRTRFGCKVAEMAECKVIPLFDI